MTNFEKYENELIEFFENNGYDSHPAVVNGKLLNCREVLCRNCVMTGDVPEVVGCRIGSYVKWLHQEYTEPKKLTKRQRAFCEAVQTGYLVRTKAGELRYSPIKPSRYAAIWSDKEISGRWYPMANHMFPDFLFIQCEDEPYSIEEMIEWEVEDE